MTNQFQKIETPNAPRAIGPYSQGISVSPGQRLIFVSGQLPIDPATGEMVQGDIQTLTHRVLDNIEAILKASNSSLEHVVRTDVFLKDLKDFAAMNTEYGKRFHYGVTPARQTIQVSDLPKSSPIEISCIAIGK